jgi:hypothetical protein
MYITCQPDTNPELIRNETLPPGMNDNVPFSDQINSWTRNIFIITLAEMYGTTIIYILLFNCR